MPFPKRPKVKTKYGNVRCSTDGRSFMSQGERDCYLMLKLMERAGEIRNLECQVSIRLGPNQRRWILDFRYFDVKQEQIVWADFKGFETDRWFHLLDLWALMGPAPLRVFKGKGLRINLVDEVVPIRA